MAETPNFQIFCPYWDTAYSATTRVLFQVRHKTDQGLIHRHTGGAEEVILEQVHTPLQITRGVA